MKNKCVEVVIPESVLKLVDEAIERINSDGWELWEIEFLKKFYQKIGLKECAKILKEHGKSSNMVCKRASDMGLTRKNVVKG